VPPNVLRFSGERPPAGRKRVSCSRALDGRTTMTPLVEDVADHVNRYCPEGEVKHRAAVQPPRCDPRPPNVFKLGGGTGTAGDVRCSALFGDLAINFPSVPNADDNHDQLRVAD
jgi:hypothetical protein